MQNSIKIWTADMANGEYRLLDSGKKEKLEEIAGAKIVRPEPRAWWSKNDPQNWQNAGKEKSFEKIISLGIGDIKVKIKYKKAAKHIGIFPEQISEWQWLANKLKTENNLNVLNLFGYTGIASLVAAQSGAKVTHVDATKATVDWAKENQKLSGLENTPIRWIVDDVLKFLKREIGRGAKYDAIIMDPPSYGRGPKGEVWKMEEKWEELLTTCRKLLSDRPVFIILNMYATELSPIALQNMLGSITKDLGGQIEIGELAIKEENQNRLLPMSLFAIWQK